MSINSNLTQSISQLPVHRIDNMIYEYIDLENFLELYYNNNIIYAQYPAVYIL